MRPGSAPPERSSEDSPPEHQVVPVSPNKDSGKARPASASSARTDVSDELKLAEAQHATALQVQVAQAPQQLTAEPPTNKPNSMQAWSADQERPARSRDKGRPQVKSLKDRQPYSEMRSRYLLTRTQFFKDFESIMPGITETLSRVALKQSGKPGDVIFRQTDPPVDCYVIMRGKVGVFISKEKQLSPRNLEEDFEEEIEEEQSRGCLAKLLGKTTGQAGVGSGLWKSKVQIKKQKRFRTAEGYNTYSETSVLGNLVATLGVCQTFGELGLLESKPRAASIICFEPCRFLVIERNVFKKFFKEKMTPEIYKKRIFMQRHVPGFEPGNELMLARLTQHPSELFHERSYKFGHEFLTEGVITDTAIFVIREGEVQFSRRNMSHFSRDVPGMAQIQRPTRTFPAKNFATLGEGKVFCSLGALGMPAHEQFSARVISPKCDIYLAQESDIRLMPDAILGALQQHIKLDLKPLLCYSGAFISLDVFPELNHRPRSPERTRSPSP